MHTKYYLIMFLLCFFVWVMLVDNVVLPSMDSLHQDNGAYTRYRIKKWDKGGKLDIIPDELMVYAVVKNHEQLYYMESNPSFRLTLDNLPEYTPVHLRYVRGFPTFWKRHLYEIRIDGQSMGYSPYSMQQKKVRNWKITGIMGGIYALLVVVGLINKRR